MQVPGSQGTRYGETDAYYMQSVMLEEWGGDTAQIATIRQMSVSLVKENPLGLAWDFTKACVSNSVIGYSIFDKWRGLRLLYDQTLLSIQLYR